MLMTVCFVITGRSPGCVPSRHRTTSLRLSAMNRAAHNRGMRTMFEFEEHKSVHGADDYYGSDFQEMFTKAASYVDDILDGAKPGGDELPIYTAALKGNRPWPMIPMKKKKGSSRN